MSSFCCDWRRKAYTEKNILYNLVNAWWHEHGKHNTIHKSRMCTTIEQTNKVSIKEDNNKQIFNVCRHTNTFLDTKNLQMWINTTIIEDVC